MLIENVVQISVQLREIRIVILTLVQLCASIHKYWVQSWNKSDATPGANTLTKTQQIRIHKQNQKQ